MKNNNIEDLFKKSFENFEAEVSPSVWKNIQTALKGAGLGVLTKTIIRKIGGNSLIAIVSSSVAIIGTVAVMHWFGSPVSRTETTTTPKTIIKKPNPIVVHEIKKFLSPEKAIAPIACEEKKENSRITQINTESVLENKQKENVVVKNSTTDKQKIKSIISTLSDEAIASISASPVGGAVPLIVSLTNSGTGKVNKWTFNDGKKMSTSTNPVHVFETPGVYTVTLTSTDENGKTSIDSVEVEVSGNSSISSIPTVFSPNGDGINDVFVFQSKNIVNMNAEIFDKKGDIVYTWEGIDGKWDGKNKKGVNAIDGLYFYIITAQGVDGKKYEQRGSINLTR